LVEEPRSILTLSASSKDLDPLPMVNLVSPSEGLPPSPGEVATIKAISRTRSLPITELPQYSERSG